jgi:penicillin-binding protein-related factor A (putative recombinase)
MSSTNESDVQKAIIKWLKSEDAWIIKVIVANERGCPDLICCYNGLFVAIEVKSPKFIKDPLKAASAWQKRHLAKIKKAKGIALCVASLDEVKDELEL